jgi:hypothetical protein
MPNLHMVLFNTWGSVPRKNLDHSESTVLEHLSILSPKFVVQATVLRLVSNRLVLVQFATNTHSLTTPTLTPIGLAVSPLLALINHSCHPNAVLVFPRSSKSAKREPEMHLVCLQEITPGDEVSVVVSFVDTLTESGNQITVSYIDTTLPCSRRRELLEDTYGFKCNCSLCSGGDRGDFDPRESLCCPNRCGGSCSLLTHGTRIPYTFLTSSHTFKNDLSHSVKSVRLGHRRTWSPFWI